jgi:hypothetical protein
MRAALLALAGTVVSLGGYGSALAHDDAAPVAVLHIDVRARIATRCGFGDPPRSPTGAPNLNVEQHIEIPFKLDCNTPFIIGVKSDNGALTSDLTPNGSGFAFTKPYKVELRIGTDGDPLTPDACDAATLTGKTKSEASCAFYGDRPGQGLSSGKRISTDQPSHLTVSWRGADPSAPRNVAGAYHDTITITVKARA